MAATLTNVPGVLNITLKQADDFSTVLDFSAAASGVTARTDIVSLVSGATVAQFGTTVFNAADGLVRISLTPAELPALVSGTYRWEHIWDYGADGKRTMLNGYLEVVK